MWGLAATSYLVAVFNRMSLGVAALRTMSRFNLSAGVLGLFSSLQLLVYLLMQVPSGVLADKWGPRRTLCLGVVLMGVGQVGFGLSHTPPMGLASRAVVGLGDALIFLNVLRLAQNWFPAGRYAFLAALTGLIGGAGQLFSTSPLRVSLARFGWVATFVTAGLLTTGLGLVLWAFVRDRPQIAMAHPQPGPALSPSAEHPSRSRAHERQRTWFALWAHFSLMGPFLTFTALWGYPYLVKAQGRSGPAAGALLALAVVAFAVAAPSAGWIASRNGLRDPMLLVTSVAVVVVWALVMGWPGGRLPAPLLLALLVVTGIGGAVSLLAFDVAREANPPERGGRATAFVNLGGFGFAVVAAFLVGAVLDLQHAAGADTIPQAFRLAFMPLLAMASMGLIQVVRLRRGPTSSER